MMGLYCRHIFPRLMDWVMSGEGFERLRSELLKDAAGKVLEIGFGTGLNLPHYPHGLASLSVIDPAAMLPNRVGGRIAAMPFPIHVTHVTAETLPFPDRHFDHVVSTWTLCTIADPLAALREVRRVLKPTGSLLFLEHGRSDDPAIAVWQDRLNPIQNIFGCGCNLNRPIDRLLHESGLATIELARFRMDHIPRIVGEMYKGQALPKPTELSVQ